MLYIPCKKSKLHTYTGTHISSCIVAILAQNRSRLNDPLDLDNRYFGNSVPQKKVNNFKAYLSWTLKRFSMITYCPLWLSLNTFYFKLFKLRAPSPPQERVTAKRIILIPDHWLNNSGVGWIVLYSLVNVSLIWRHHQCSWRAANLDQC